MLHNKTLQAITIAQLVDSWAFYLIVIGSNSRQGSIIRRLAFNSKSLLYLSELFIYVLGIYLELWISYSTILLYCNKLCTTSCGQFSVCLLRTNRSAVSLNRVLHLLESS